MTRPLSTPDGQDASLAASQLLVSSGAALLASSSELQVQALGAILMIVGAVLVFLRGRAKPYRNGTLPPEPPKLPPGDPPSG